MSVREGFLGSVVGSYRRDSRACVSRLYSRRATPLQLFKCEVRVSEKPNYFEVVFPNVNAQRIGVGLPPITYSAFWPKAVTWSIKVGGKRAVPAEHMPALLKTFGIEE